MNPVSRLKDWTRIFGPAWLVMIADIDIASIVTALQAGATWGYSMIFITIILTLPLFFIQDAAGRLGTAGGLGLGAAIAKFYGRRIAVLAAVPMTISDFLMYMAEYGGIAIGMSLIGFPILAGLAIAFLIHSAIVISRQYRQAEMVLIPLSFLVVGGIVASTLLFPINWGKLFVVGLSPLQPYGNPSFDFLLAATIGAVVMPFMLYFHSGADSRKKLDAKDLKMERLETLVGAIVSEILMAVIVLDGMHLPNTSNFLGASELSIALSVFGKYAPLLLGFGFIFAGFLALVVISLGSTWGAMEALGWRSKGTFLKVYLLESLPAILLVIVIGNYIKLLLSLMVIFTIIIIPSLYFLGKLISNEKVMNGQHYKKYEKIIFWVMSASVVLGGILGLVSFLH
jgi:Mn2+/Fe2+ NRAMP family transporter